MKKIKRGLLIFALACIFFAQATFSINAVTCYDLAGEWKGAVYDINNNWTYPVTLLITIVSQTAPYTYNISGALAWAGIVWSLEGSSNSCVAKLPRIQSLTFTGSGSDIPFTLSSENYNGNQISGSHIIITGGSFNQVELAGGHFYRP